MPHDDSEFQRTNEHLSRLLTENRALRANLTATQERCNTLMQATRDLRGELQSYKEAVHSVTCEACEDIHEAETLQAFPAAQMRLDWGGGL